jgi:PIN domain nuclease of toxin-antitoxin system
MKVLLDTQALLWWLSDSPHLGREARSVIADGGTTVYVSAVSAWEMEIKSALGRLRTPDNLEVTLAKERFLELPVRIVHTTALRDLPSLHRDPFDRLLIAQARVEHLILVTSDSVFERYGLPTIQV